MLTIFNRNIQFPLKDQIGKYFIMGLVVFLFILFFQPFPLDQLKSENRLLYVTGFGGITFLFGLLTLGILQGKKSYSEDDNDIAIFFNLIYLTLNITAIGFYIRFVGLTPITFYIMFKVILICLLPVIYNIMLIKTKRVEQHLLVLQQQNKYLSDKLNEFKSGEGEELEIISNTKTDNLRLNANAIIFIQSADNYIEIFCMQDDTVQKKLIRNTLKNLELQLNMYDIFIRCHRTSIVNKKYIKNLVHKDGKNTILLKETDYQIPVSRNYLQAVKALISR